MSLDYVTGTHLRLFTAAMLSRYGPEACDFMVRSDRRGLQVLEHTCVFSRSSHKLPSYPDVRPERKCLDGRHKRHRSGCCGRGVGLPYCPWICMLIRERSSSRRLLWEDFYSRQGTLRGLERVDRGCAVRESAHRRADHVEHCAKERLINRDHESTDVGGSLLSSAVR